MRKGSRAKPRNGDSTRRGSSTARGHIPAEEGIEAGIATVFAAIQAEGLPEEEDEGPDNTFAILAELNRLWLSAPAA